MRAVCVRLSRRFTQFRPDLLTFVESSVKQVIKSHANVFLDNFDTSSTFKQLGFDFLEQTRLIVETENHFGIQLTQREFLEIESVFDLVSVVNAYVSREFLLKSQSQEQTVVANANDGSLK